MSPKVTQNRAQNEAQKVSKMEMPIVSKTHYIFCFSYIMPLQRLPKICTISYKMRLPTPCTYFDSQK